MCTPPLATLEASATTHSATICNGCGATNKNMHTYININFSSELFKTLLQFIYYMWYRSRCNFTGAQLSWNLRVSFHSIAKL